MEVLRPAVQQHNWRPITGDKVVEALPIDFRVD